MTHFLSDNELKGFYTFLREQGRDHDPAGIFAVRDGLLRISGAEWGCLTTLEAYDNYRLIAEFKWGEQTHAPREGRARDSGILLHSAGDDGAYGGTWMHSIECQIIEGGTGDFIVVGDGSTDFAITCPVAEQKDGGCHVYDPAGECATIHSGRINWWGRDPDWTDIKGFRGKRDVERPPGEWNVLECIAHNDTITVILNGVVVNQCINVRPSRGKIQIQSEGAEIFFRRLDLMPLAPQGDAAPCLIVCNKHEDTLSFVNPETFEPSLKIKVGPNPHEIALTPDGRYAYLSNYRPPGNTISLIDLVKRTHVKQISTGDYSRIHGAAMAPDGRHVYFTAGQTGVVVEVDTQTHEMTRAIRTEGKISHMVLVSPDGRRLYTANIETQNVSVIDRDSAELVAQIPCGPGCEGMAITPDGKHLWVANQTAGTVTIVDLDALEPVDTFPCPGMPVRIRFTPDGKRALISGWTEAGHLVVIDTMTRREIKRLDVGSFAIGLELSPDGKRAFVGCEHLDGVHVIDLETLDVTNVFKTGDGSDAIAWWQGIQASR